MIIRNRTCKNKDIMIPIYKALIRPLLEYANSIWCPHYKKYVKILEKVQRHYTKLINGVKDLSYEERLKKPELPSLEYRRLRGNLIEE